MTKQAKSKSLRDEAQSALQNAREIRKRLDEEDEDVPEDERQKMHSWFDECEEKLEKAKRLEREGKLKEGLDSSDRSPQILDGDILKALGIGSDGADQKIALEGVDVPKKVAGIGDYNVDYSAHKDAIRAFMRKGTSGLTPDQKKELSSLTDDEGGFLVTEEFRAELLEKIRDVVHIREMSTTLTTSNSSMGIPTFDYDGSFPQREEADAYAIEDILDAFGFQRFTPHARGLIFKVPEELLEDAEIDLVSLFTTHFGTRYGEIEEEVFITGSGSNEPLGIETFLNDQSQTTALSGSSGTFDPSPEDVYDTVYALRKVHRRNGAWLLHRNAIKKYRKIRTKPDGTNATGEFIWQPGLRAGEPATLAGFPIMESEFINDPDDSTSAGDNAGIFGNWQHYWIVDRNDLSVFRFEEKYRDNGKIGVRLRKRMDAAPTRVDAWTMNTIPS